jgi:transcriptional regulator with XRE-family HTH domain
MTVNPQGQVRLLKVLLALKPERDYTVAQAVGISGAHLSRIADSIAKNPSRSTVQKLADVFRVPVGAILAPVSVEGAIGALLNLAEVNTCST